MPNRFLADRSPEDLDRLGELERVEYAPGEVIIAAGDLWTHYTFIECGYVSAIANGANGQQIDIGIVGSVGFIGVTGFSYSSERRAAYTYTARLRTSGLRAPADRVHDAVRASPEMRETVRRLTAAADQIHALNAVCQARHSIEQRAARWWLTIRAALGSSTIPLSQATLGSMLGGVTRQALSKEVYKPLIAAGVIARLDGGIILRDVHDLANRACECLAEWQAIVDAVFR